MEKGGWPKKVKRGKKPEHSTTDPKTPTTLQDLDTLTSEVPSLRFDEFSEKFLFPENLRKELMCPVCIQILDKPVETTCQHYFCVECMKGVIDSGQGGSCPVCKESIGPLKVPTRMVLRLIAEQEVICTNCRKSINYEDSAAHVCDTTRAQATIPDPQQPAVLPPHNQALQQILEDAQVGQFLPAVEKICTAYVKTKMKELVDGKTVLFKTGGKVFFCFYLIQVITYVICPCLLHKYPGPFMFL